MKGLKIVPVKIVRYELRGPDGRKIKTFATRSAATAYANGYLKALAFYGGKK